MAQRPNILLITTDQQRTDSLSCYGSPFTFTPHFDRLADQGACLQRAYCTNPVCTPSRVSLYTGQKLSRHGAWNIGVSARADEPMISHRLAAAGYRTHAIGKLHFQPYDATPEQSMESTNGWQQHYPQFTGPYYGFETVELCLGHATYGMAGHYGAWVRQQIGDEQYQRYTQSRRLSSTHFGGEAHDWDLPLRLHNSVWTADRAVDFLRAQDNSRPFLLSVGFQDPHHPHAVPTEFDLRVDPAAVPPPQYTEGELLDKPPFFEQARHGRLPQSDVRGQFPIAGQGNGADFTRVGPDDARLGRAYYHTLVRLIDQQLGRILDALDQARLADDTLVIVTTDHGDLLGDHGLWMKGPFHYEQLIRVPLLMRWPQTIPAGARPSGLLSHVDIVPTILSAAGMAIPSDLDGVDALPLLRGQSTQVRQSALVECVDDPEKLNLKTLVTADRKLTWYQGRSYGELYDLEKDPLEITNHWDDPAYAADKTQLLAEILDNLDPNEPTRRLPRVSYA